MYRGTIVAKYYQLKEGEVYIPFEALDYLSKLGFDLNRAKKYLSFFELLNEK
ncbi:MAG: hypothetical protein NZ893_02900 [Candidatus Aenigmarchaeota archaeon]|nr:hypothetical protein [Candidatus Aenigmarchaeota archaeon]